MMFEVCFSITLSCSSAMAQVLFEKFTDGNLNGIAFKESTPSPRFKKSSCAGSCTLDRSIVTLNAIAQKSNCSKCIGASGGGGGTSVSPSKLDGSASSTTSSSSKNESAN